MAIANANYEFIMCDVGTNGRVSDGGVLRNTKFYEKLVADTLKIPKVADGFLPHGVDVYGCAALETTTDMTQYPSVTFVTISQADDLLTPEEPPPIAKSPVISVLPVA
ncbi:hypothetical protein NQ315_008786 [Exocentrus adspersus]|uniref:Uncharacterized protein n=1 Tax=Exocentrus adspersus TaxID=1586481 RepID=A0AAV8VGR9_9CUCU|nr:hypothetical protein NQ315_008786 [Exocentrus adspersus]